MTLLARASFSLAALATLMGAAAARPLAAQGGPPPEVRTMIDGVVTMLRGSGDSTLTVFAEKQVAPEYRKQFTGDGLMEHLRLLRVVAADGDGSVSVQGAPGSVLISLARDGSAKIRLEWNDKLLVTKLVDESGTP